MRLREGEFSGHRRVPAPAPGGQRATSTHAIAFEGLFRLPGGRPAAAADPRHPRRTPPDLDADDGQRARRSAAPRPRRHPGLVVRDRGRAEQPLPRPCPGPARLWLLEQAAARRATTPAGSPRRHARADGRARDRASPRRRQLDGRPDRDRDRPAWPRAGRRARPAVPRRGLDQARPSPDRPAAAARVRPSAPRLPPLHGGQPVLEPLLRPGCHRPRGGRADGGRVPAHLPQRRALATRSWPAPATSTWRRRSAPGASTRGWPGWTRRRCSSGAATTRSSPRPSAATCATGCPSAEQVTLDGCGHVPQVERAEEINGSLIEFFARR